MSGEEVDRLLHARGDRYREWGDRGDDDVADLGRRVERHGRNRRMIATAALLAVLAGVGVRALVGDTAKQVVGLNGDDPTPSTVTSAPAPTTAPVVPVAPASSSTTVAVVSSTTVVVAPPAGRLTTTSSVGPVVGVRSVDWRNMTYPGDACGPTNTPAGGYVVHDGQGPAVGEITNSGQDAFVAESIDAGDTVGYGDLTGDGRDEAVVSVFCRSGGSFKWSVPWLYTTDPAAAGGIRRLTAVDPPPGAALHVGPRFLVSAVIEAGRLTTSWSAVTETDPVCCPTKLVTFHQRWTGSALTPDGTPTVTDLPSQ
jgi:hypothetical protein